jgi:DNA primase
VSVFEALGEQVSLLEIVGRYCDVRGGKARCVARDHRDANPSMHLYDDHVHCFTCGFHGDVVDVWATIKGLDRPIEAAFDLAQEYGVKLPKMNSEARKSIHAQRAKVELYCQQARACHNALAHHPRVADWWKGRGFHKELRQHFLLGTNKSGTAAVVPFWHRGRVQGLIRRKLWGKPKYIYPKTEEFPAGYRPLFVPGPVCGDVFLVEGIVDALALAAFGESVVAVGGTSISEPQMRELEKLPGLIYILPDRDEEGEAAAHKWVRELYPKALLCPAEYGEEVGDA